MTLNVVKEVPEAFLQRLRYIECPREIMEALARNITRLHYMVEMVATMPIVHGVLKGHSNLADVLRDKNIETLLQLAAMDLHEVHPAFHDAIREVLEKFDVEKYRQVVPDLSVLCLNLEEPTLRALLGVKACYKIADVCAMTAADIEESALHFAPAVEEVRYALRRLGLKLAGE